MRLFARPGSQSAARFVGITTFLSGKLANGQLSTDYGVLSVNTNGHQAEKALFAIRPEHISVQAAAGTNTIAGIIRDCIYRGDYIEYQVAVGKMNIRARVSMPAEPIEHDQPVYVKLPAEHLFEIEPQ
jgi:ABC-type Fe3+/spermidine/putrescine transport system ATPase subunit